MQLRLFYCDHHEIALPAGHKFPMRKYRLLRETLAREADWQFTPAPLASPETIALVHERAYVDAFLAGTLSAAALRRVGFPWSQGLVSRTLASVGGTLSAAHDALASGFGGGLAGGTHHAFRSEGAGFCVFNDMAIAITALRQEGCIASAAVLDLDVHQGDGTAKIFEDDDGVLTISMHGKNNFPFRKQSSRIDVELPDRAGDSEYLSHVPQLLDQAVAFQPGILFYQSGVDSLREDCLGKLSLTAEGLKERDRLVLERCAAEHLPCVVTLGGGYATPIELTVEAHANTFRTAHAIYSDPIYSK